MTRSLNVACLQTEAQPDFASALTQALSLATMAVEEGAQLLALPEYCGGLRSEGSHFSPPAAIEAEHPVLLGLQKFAKDHSVWIVVGSVAVPGLAGKICNRGFIIDDVGQICSRYDKVHLFDIALSEQHVYLESATVQSGDLASVVDTPFARLGHTICYDLRFPDLYRQLAQAGAEILLTPAAFTKRTGEAHWHVLNRARAIENGAFMISPCAIGKIEGGGESYGHSLIISPWGEVLADGGDDAGVVHATIDLDQVAETRKKIPSLEHDRQFTVHNINSDRA